MHCLIQKRILLHFSPLSPWRICWPATKSLLGYWVHVGVWKESLVVYVPESSSLHVRKHRFLRLPPWYVPNLHTSEGLSGASGSFPCLGWTGRWSVLPVWNDWLSCLRVLRFRHLRYWIANYNCRYKRPTHRRTYPMSGCPMPHGHKSHSRGRESWNWSDPVTRRPQSPRYRSSLFPSSHLLLRWIPFRGAVRPAFESAVRAQSLYWLRIPASLHTYGSVNHWSFVHEVAAGWCADKRSGPFPVLP